MLDWAIAGGGLAILLVAGDMLVRGAEGLGVRLGVSPLVISLTVVSFGTSAPELFIAVNAVLSGVPGIAIGNVVGSNTANVLLILGVPALLSRIPATDGDTFRSYVLMLLASLWFIGLCFLGPLTWWHGPLMLGFLVALGISQGRESRRIAAAQVEIVTDTAARMRGWQIALFLILGIVGLPVGADMLVDAGSRIAAAMGVSQTAIGLTLVAVGTSLPELATTTMAAIQRKADVALGNVIGSNVFNLLGIIGVASLFGTIPIEPQTLRFDLWVMLGASLVLGPFIFRERYLGRRAGVVFILLYAAYVWMVLA